MFDSDEATVMEGAVFCSAAQTAPAVFRSRMMDPVPAAYHPVPAVYDAADDGDEYQATMLLEGPSAASPSNAAPPVRLAAPAPYRNAGGTLLMPAAQSIEMRDAIMASMRHLQSQHPQQYAHLASVAPRAANMNAVAASLAPPAPPALSRFELAFAGAAAILIGLTAALLFVYFF